MSWGLRCFLPSSISNDLLSANVVSIIQLFIIIHLNAFLLLPLYLEAICPPPGVQYGDFILLKFKKVLINTLHRNDYHSHHAAYPL